MIFSSLHYNSNLSPPVAITIRISLEAAHSLMYIHHFKSKIPFKCIYTSFFMSEELSECGGSFKRANWDILVSASF